MRRAWKGERKLPKVWKVLLTAIEICCPVAMGASPFFFEKYIALAKYLPVTIITLAGFTIVSALILKLYERPGSPHRTYVNVILRHLREHLWEDVLEEIDGAPQLQRITYFEVSPIGRLGVFLHRGKYTHILIPRTRTPSGGRRSRRCWKVHEHNADHCEGFAGQIFAAGGNVCVSPKLPNLHDSKHKNKRVKIAQSSIGTRLRLRMNRLLVRLGFAEPKPPIERPYHIYAERTQDTPVKVESECYYARVIGGVAILKGGRRKGVLILDSTEPSYVTSELFQSDDMRRYMKMLGDIV